MANATIGQAYVQILPSMKGMSKAITSGGKSEVSTAGSSLGSGLGKSIVGTLKKVVVTAGIGSVISTSISEGGKLQQSLGGVETLFGDAAETVKKNASNAWRTVGMSANEYMEQTTSFAASLVSSLGGDTAKAAELADVAMQDMADNANKMGTDMTSITNAYQGFAKQNYSMLDNLKLGYGGCQSEMQRLVKEASEMTDVQKKLGVSVDSTSMSYDNIVQAIHVVQENMKINGTTAKEAATTLTGSVAMMKSAWTDFLGQVSTGGDLSKPLNNLLTSVGTFASNLLPMVGSILKSIWDLIANTNWTEHIQTAFTNIQKSVGEIDWSKIWEQAVGIVEGIGDAFKDLSGKVVEWIQSVDWSSVALNIYEKLTELVTSIDYLGILQSAVDLIKGIIPSIIDFMFGAQAGASNLAASVVNKLKEMLAGIDWAGIGETIKGALANASDFLSGLLDSIGEIASGIDWGAIATTIWDALKSAFDTGVDIATTVYEWIVNALSGIDWAGIWDSIQNAGSGIGDAITNLIGSIDWAGIWEAIKDAFGNAGDFVSDAFDKVTDLINQIDWAELGKTIIELLGKALVGALAITGEILAKLIELLGEVDWGELATNILEFLASALLAGLDIIGGAVEGIFEGLGDVLGLDDLANDLNDAWSDMKSDASEGFEGIKSKVSSGLKSAKNKISDFKKEAPKVFKDAIESINSKASGIKDAAKTIKDKFEDIKNSISDKLEAARKKVKEIIDRIKGLFDFSWSLPTLKVPHISVDGGEAPWGIGGLGHLPSFDVTWAAKGGILDGATLVGAGEAGKEALLPLERNTGWMDTLADRISSKGDTVINVQMTVNGSESPEEWGQRFIGELNRQVRMGVV